MEFTSIASSSAGNAYLLRSGESSFLLDPGIPWAKIRDHIGTPSSVKGAFVSHSHLDHCKATVDLVTNFIKIFASKECRAEIANQIKKTEERQLFQVRSFNLPPLTEVSVFDTGWRVIGIPVAHDAAGTMAAMVKAPDGETLFYLTDSPYSPALPGSSPTIIAVECNYSSAVIADKRIHGGIDSKHYQRVIKSHMSSDQCMEFLRAMKGRGLLTATKAIHLLHLSDDNSDESAILKEAKSITGIPTYTAAKETRHA